MAKAAAAKGYGDEEDESALRHDGEDEKMRGPIARAAPIRTDDEAGDTDEGRWRRRRSK